MAFRSAANLDPVATSTPVRILLRSPPIAITTIQQSALRWQRSTRVAGDKECDGGKSEGDDEKSCGRVTATAPKREMAAATRAAGDKEGDGGGGESDGGAYKEDEGGG